MIFKLVFNKSLLAADIWHGVCQSEIQDGFLDTLLMCSEATRIWLHYSGLCQGFHPYFGYVITQQHCGSKVSKLCKMCNL